MADVGEPNEGYGAMSLAEIGDVVKAEGERVKELGGWAPYVTVERSLLDRIPKGENDDEKSPGFDAGLACTLDLIPRNKQKLSAIMHAGINAEAVAQIRQELQTLDPDSETIWWLAACDVCDEGGINASGFKGQIKKFEELALDPAKRLAAAQREHAKMISTFETSTYGVPYGTVDGCMHGAYIAGYPLATMYGETYGIYFIGSINTPLDDKLAAYPWKDPDQEGRRGNSGLINPTFVKCADEEEFKAVLAYLGQRMDLSAQ